MSAYLDFFHSLERFGIKPGLERILELLELLGNPQEKLKFLHVAGTNGKGSVCTFLSQILKASSYKTGLYISPYVVDFRERIQIDNKMISEETLEKSAEKVKNAVKKLADANIEITEFEAVTAAAFLCFLEEKCDFVVLETGLGGRFDATNIIAAPEVSVITSISLDHVKILGDNIAQIAFEKCGIIKKDCPVVTNNSQQKDALDVIKEIANQKNCRLSVAESEKLSISVENIFGSSFIYKNEQFNISMPGRHQIENAVTAIEAVKAAEIPLNSDSIYQGLNAAQIPARIQVISAEPLIILDGSHNEGSTFALKSVAEKFLKEKKILGIIGMMGDKDIEKSLSNLAPIFSHIITTKPSNDRANPPEELNTIISEFGISCESVENPKNAFGKAKLMLREFDALIICGSLYLAADIYRIIPHTEYE